MEVTTWATRGASLVGAVLLLVGVILVASSEELVVAGIVTIGAGVMVIVAVIGWVYRPRDSSKNYTQVSSNYEGELPRLELAVPPLQA